MAAAAARRQDAHNDVDVNVNVDDATSSGTTNASKAGGTMPTANGGKWLHVVDVAIDKGSDDDDNCDDANGDGDGGGRSSMVVVAGFVRWSSTIFNIKL